jgi:hypothetical protein
VPALAVLPQVLSTGVFPKNNQVPKCLQIGCDLSVCAENDDDAAYKAGAGVAILMGADCGSWTSNANSGGQGPCADGLTYYKGEYVIWRAWVPSTIWYAGSFPQWGNFLGANCGAWQSVKCVGKSGMCPNGQGQCSISCPKMKT